MRFLDPRGKHVEDFELEILDAAIESIFSAEFIRRHVRKLESEMKIMVIVDPAHHIEVDMQIYDQTPRKDLVEFIEKWSNPSPEVKRDIEKQTGKFWRSN